MKILASAVCALALLAGAGFIAAPAMARPLHVTVRGATPILPPDAYGYGAGYGYGASSPEDYDFYGNPTSRGYDPAGKFPDYRYFGPPAVDLVLARTLDANNESILGHMMRCQATYPSYNTATNFYTGRHGQPMICYR